jgi:hypothetical protein
MTEAEWLAGADPEPMLAFLLGRASERKLRLFAAACSRRVWPLIDDLGRAAVEAAELYADGQIDSDVLRAARLACRGAGERAAWYAAASSPATAAGNAARSARYASANPLAEAASQADLLREVFGNPFRPVTFNRLWLTPAAVSLAQTIDDERDYARMPELAGALESAGCRDAEIGTHCRGRGTHVRGCWVVDRVLGKA